MLASRLYPTSNIKNHCDFCNGFTIFNTISFIFIEVSISYFWNVDKYKRIFIYMANGHELEARASGEAEGYVDKI